MPLDPSIIDLHYRVEDYYEVGREKIREYATAVKDDHPAHYEESEAAELGYDALIAPPTFISVFGLIAQKRLFEVKAMGMDLHKVLQTDQRLVFHRPIKAGDRLCCDVSVDSLRQMAGADILVTKNMITNQDGESVLTTYTTLVHRDDIEVEGVG